MYAMTLYALVLEPGNSHVLVSSDLPDFPQYLNDVASVHSSGQVAATWIMIFVQYSMGMGS